MKIRHRLWFWLTSWLMNEFPIVYVYAPGDVDIRVVSIATDINVLRRIYSGYVPFTLNDLVDDDQKGDDDDAADPSGAE